MAKKERVLKTPRVQKARQLAGLRMVKAKHGRLMAHEVFEDAHSKRHPLHRDFEWDQREGWRQYNLEIARTLISMFRLELVDVHTGKTIKAPMFLNFHNLPGQKGAQPYHEITTVLRRPNYMHRAMETGVREILPIVERWTWHDVLGPACSRFAAEIRSIGASSEERKRRKRKRS